MSAAGVFPLLQSALFAMPEQAQGQQAPQGGGIGVLLNRIVLGFLIYSLVFGNPLKGFFGGSNDSATDPAALLNGTVLQNMMPPSSPTPQSKSGKHHPMLLPGTMLVRKLGKSA